MAWDGHRAALTAAVLVVVLGIALASGLAWWASGQGGGSVSASVQARTFVTFAERAPDGGGELQVTVVNQGTGARNVIGEPDSYTALAWSPKGGSIAALSTASGPGQGARLHLLAGDGRSETIVALPPEADAVFPAWSPDGSRVAVVGARVYVITSGGQVISEAVAPALPGAAGLAHESGGFAWSRDSGVFATTINGSLILAGRDGDIRMATLSDLGIAGSGEAVTLLGWESPSLLVLGVPLAAAVEGFIVDAAAPALGATPVAAGTSLPVPTGARPIEEPAVEAVRGLAPGSEIFRTKPSADGQADIFEVRRSVEGSPSVSDSSSGLVIRDRHTGAVFEVRGLPADTRGGWLFDAFVQASP